MHNISTPCHITLILQLLRLLCTLSLPFTSLSLFMLTVPQVLSLQEPSVNTVHTKEKLNLWIKMYFNIWYCIWNPFYNIWQPRKIIPFWSKDSPYKINDTSNNALRFLWKVFCLIPVFKLQIYLKDFLFQAFLGECRWILWSNKGTIRETQQYTVFLRLVWRSNSQRDTNTNYCCCNSDNVQQSCQQPRRKQTDDWHHGSIILVKASFVLREFGYPKSLALCLLVISFLNPALIFCCWLYRAGPRPGKLPTL